ncbi:hypothetical protein AVEN_243708-1 [Araneus ventricosus]|uniref:Uncharacterized protein n=1 Tax=Araneus ventricosus TaxID=182803 RepID=A0A4Y2A564_ARAVE|nr:hypothetical protein AVEN_243708-1 [Araneus ventricosus]
MARLRKSNWTQEERIIFDLNISDDVALLHSCLFDENTDVEDFDEVCSETSNHDVQERGGDSETEESDFETEDENETELPEFYSKFKRKIEKLPIPVSGG